MGGLAIIILHKFLLYVVWSLSVEARPQLLEALNKVTEVLNDTTISLLKTLTPNNHSRYSSNSTKTRILFRGDLSEEFGDQDIIFPDTYQVIFDNVPKISGPPKCAKGKTFCENVEEYPYLQIQDILTRRKVQTDLFGKDEAPDDSYIITNRNGDYETFICGSIEKTIFPQIGKNKNNKWRYIINQGERNGYAQGIRIELCRKEGSACDLVEQSEGYITSCKQKYMLRRMMSLSENGTPVPDSILMPSACCCSYKKDPTFFTRFGAEDISPRTKIKSKTTNSRNRN